ncbi:MAG TPA: ATP-binding protein [Caulobacteraceae bacterium]|jgi:two-component system cell cycle sensor histidine kinase/response regulator CckA
MILRRSTPGPAVWLEALDGPACLVRLDGAIEASNAAWRAAIGPGRRLPPAWNLYGALKEARAGGRGLASAPAGEIAVSRLDLGLFLVRVEAPSHAAQARPAANLDACSPFGAALIAGRDPFAGEIVEVNPAMVAIAGEAARPGARLTDLIAASSLGEARAAGPGPFEVGLASSPERTAHLYLVAAGAGSLAYLHDVSEQKQLQSRLAQRNRMESVGQLAGGVAHDFNNLLTAIRLRADELLLRHSLGDPSFDSLAEIRETVERAAGVVRQLLTFSRKATLQREVVDLGEALTDTAVLLRRLVREDVALEIEYGQNLPLIRIDRSQLETAIINLVVNARDALRAKGGGQVRIRTARLDLAAARALGYAGLEAAELALLEVADDGPGIEPEALAKIFEPFFTTKPLGEGTGLGLATVYGVVKQADGWIAAASTLGEGAIFRIFLPAYHPPLAFEPAAQPEAARAAPRDLSGVGRILFVEDEVGVRGVAARLLRARGYEVIEAADGEEALALIKVHAGTIDLMISDVIMPGMDGPTLLKAARPWLGEAPVMFISGYAEAEFSELLEGETGVSFLPKPLSIQALAERVKAQLRPPGRAA